MDMSNVKTALDRLLEPVSRALTPEVAKRLVALKADEQVQQRVDELLDRNAEGQITPEEKSELEALVAAGDMISILQAKARLLLAGNSAA